MEERCLADKDSKTLTKHEYKNFIQRITPDYGNSKRLHFDGKRYVENGSYKGGNYYFIVRACMKCKKKSYLDLRRAK